MRQEPLRPVLLEAVMYSQLFGSPSQLPSVGLQSPDVGLQRKKRMNDPRRAQLHSSIRALPTSVSVGRKVATGVSCRINHIGDDRLVQLPWLGSGSVLKVVRGFDCSVLAAVAALVCLVAH